MANTLNNLIPTIYNALDVVSREMVGMIPSVTVDAQFTRAAKGQVVRSPVTPAVDATDITPAVTPPNDGDQTVGSVAMEITKARRVPVRWNGEEQLGLSNNGAEINVILSNQFAQAMRTLSNEIESDLAALNVSASRAIGTAATNPFATDQGTLADVLKELLDNGAPKSDLQCCINTAAGAAMRKVSNLYKVNESGEDSFLRRGVLQDIYGFAIRESAQIQNFVKGNAVSAKTDNSGYDVGDTVIGIDATSTSGAIKAGDIITINGDTNKYVVVKGEADISDGGEIEIAAPGLKKEIGTSAKDITLQNNSARNLAFSRSALALATRAPARPSQGDSATDVTLVTDPVSGITFEVSEYKQYRQVQYEVAIAWGTKLVKPEHAIILLG